MYIPNFFQEKRPAELLRLIRENPLGILVAEQAGLLDANHLPFELVQSEDSGNYLLRAHVARANPLWQEAEGVPVLVIFRAADAYVSPNWYPSKQETHQLVPTWNYRVVHVRGHLRVMDDQRFLLANLGRLTRLHEAKEPQPWKMSDAAPGVINELLTKVVGIEIPIEEMIGKFKLSQNRSTTDRLGAAEQLALRGAEELAEAMRRVED